MKKNIDVWGLYKRNPSICWESMKFVRPREVSFVCVDDKRFTRRFISIGTYDFLMNTLYNYYEKLKNHQFHFFASIELVKKTMDGRPLDLQKTYDVFGWDLVFDIDSKGRSIKERFSKSHIKAKKIVKVLIKDKIPFRVQFSGSKGFHVFLLWDELKKKYKPEDYGVVNREIAAGIWKKAKVKTDITTFSKAHDLIRVPFSVHPKTGLLCLPLTLKEFMTFKPSMATIENNVGKDYRNFLSNKGVIKLL